jgi:hypothetical protein
MNKCFSLGEWLPDIGLSLAPSGAHLSGEPKMRVHLTYLTQLELPWLGIVDAAAPCVLQYCARSVLYDRAATNNVPYRVRCRPVTEI